jgi:hypothetical protein
MILDKAINATYELNKCHKTAKRFYGEKYQETIKPFIHILKEVMKANGLGEVAALLLISKTEMYNDSGMVQMLFMSAVVEVMLTNEK